MNWKNTLYHDGTPFFRQPPSAATGSDLVITLRVWKKAPLERVFLRTCPDGEEEMLAMEAAAEDDFFTWYKALVVLPRPDISYRFFIVHSEGGLWYNQNGIHTTTPPDRHDFRLDPPGALPDWVPGTVFYQIFPDRFCNGDPALNITDGAYEYRGKQPRLLAWDSPEPHGEENGHIFFYGGDLAGIRQKIGWLQELGVTGVYLTPVFHAPSNHKYDTQDFDIIDPHFGTNEDFAALTRELHDKGIRIILDGVFNHVGVAHRWFNRCGFYEGGAWNDPDSAYREFFYFDRYPEDYRCWKGVESLPKLNFNSQQLRDCVYRAPDSAAQRWLREPYLVDGWRFDVANMLGRSGPDQLQDEVWTELRRSLRDASPQCYLLGEHFFDGNALMERNHLDGLMHYQGFTFAVWKWLSGADSFLSGWERIRYSCPFTAADMAAQMREFRSGLTHGQSLCMLNLLNSHDTPRLITVLEGDSERYLAALALLFTCPGTPSILYGDEIGLGGGGDPDCRRPMPWDEGNQDMTRLALYRKLIALRKARPSLSRGGMLELSVAPDHFAFARVLGPEVTCTLVRKAETAEPVCLPLYPLGHIEGRVRDLLSGREADFSRGFLKWECAPLEAAILEILP